MPEIERVVTSRKLMLWEGKRCCSIAGAENHGAFWLLCELVDGRGMIAYGFWERREGERERVGRES